MHVADEGRDAVAVAHFKAGRFDLHRLVAVLRKALQRIRHALAGGGRRGAGLRRCGRRRADGERREHAAPPRHRPRERHGALHRVSPPKFMCTTTPPSNFISAPESTISSRLALSTPLVSFTLTGF